MKLKVEVISEEIIKPSSPTPPQLYHYQLSSLDQIQPPIYNHLVLFYPNHSDVQTDNIEIVDQLKLSVSKALTYFYPLAGRIKDDFVDCNDEGIPFKEAQVKCQLSNFLQNPIPQEVNKMFPFPLDDAVAVLPMGIQFNTFDCGGVGIGLCISHKIGDGLSYFTFLNTWAAITRGDEKNIVLPEFVSAKLFPPHNVSSLPRPEVDTKEIKIATKRFVFNASKIEEIRAKYADSGSLENQTKHPSRIEALSAYIWSRFIAATKEKYSSPESDSFHMIIHTVNLRTKFEPPLPYQSFGNIFRVSITVPSMDKDGDCHNLVTQMRDSIRKIDKEYVRKLQLGEDFVLLKHEQRGCKGEVVPFVFTSLCRFPIYEADFGWGKPVWVSPATLSAKNIVVFMDTASGDGIEAYVNLQEEDMAAFRIE